MSGYIGSKASVTLVDGYTQAEADAEFVAKAGDTMTGGLTVGGAFTSLGIDDNATSTAVTIDSAGRVTMPYQPAFKVRTNYASHTTLSNVSPDWTIVDHNTGNHFNVSTNAFTAPVSGRYLFSVHSLISMPSNYAYIEIKVNGNRVGIIHSPNGNISTYFDLSLTELLDLNANDIVSVSTYNAGSCAWYAGVTYNAFSGYLIG